MLGGGYVALLTSTGLVLNRPSELRNKSAGQSYDINNTAITKFPANFKFKPDDGANSTYIRDFKSGELSVYLWKQEIVFHDYAAKEDQDSKTYLLIVVPTKETQDLQQTLKSKMSGTFTKFFWYACVLIVSSFIFALLFGIPFSNKIVKPLTQLTEFAKSISNRAQFVGRGNQKIENQISLDEIQVKSRLLAATSSTYSLGLRYYRWTDRSLPKARERSNRYQTWNENRIHNWRWQIEFPDELLLWDENAVETLDWSIAGRPPG